MDGQPLAQIVEGVFDPLVGAAGKAARGNIALYCVTGGGQQAKAHGKRQKRGKGQRHRPSSGSMREE
jgi:hypothetical protein